jgi:hypothetical protein
MFPFQWRKSKMLKTLVLSASLCLALASPAFASSTCGDDTLAQMEKDIKAMPEGPHKDAAMKEWKMSDESMKAKKMDDCNGHMDAADKEMKSK